MLRAPVIVSSCDKYVLFPFEPAPASQELPAGLALGSSTLRAGGKEFTACNCVGLLWLNMLWKIHNQHLCEQQDFYHEQYNLLKAFLNHMYACC